MAIYRTPDSQEIYRQMSEAMAKQAQAMPVGQYEDINKRLGVNVADIVAANQAARSEALARSLQDKNFENNMKERELQARQREVDMRFGPNSLDSVRADMIKRGLLGPDGNAPKAQGKVNLPPGYSVINGPEGDRVIRMRPDGELEDVPIGRGVSLEDMKKKIAATAPQPRPKSSFGKMALGATLTGVPFGRMIANNL